VSSKWRVAILCNHLSIYRIFKDCLVKVRTVPPSGYPLLASCYQRLLQLLENAGFFVLANVVGIEVAAIHGNVDTIG
jgi:hypothetical protein